MSEPSMPAAGSGQLRTLAVRISEDLRAQLDIIAQLTGRSATEEIRLVSRQDQKLRWSVGAFHEQYHRFYPQDVYSPGLDAAFADLYGVPGFTSIGQYGTPRNDDFFYGTIDVKEHQTALFGEVTYEVVPKVDVTLGARYFNFKQDFNLFFTGLAGALAPGEPLVSNSTTTSSRRPPAAGRSTTGWASSSRSARRHRPCTRIRG